MKRRKEPNLIRKNFYMFFFLACGAFLFHLLVSFFDGVLSSNLLSFEAYKATQVVGPVKALFSFTSNLFVTGVGVLYFLYMGKGEKKRATNLAGLGLIINLSLGIINGVGIYFLKQPIIAFYNLGEEVNSYINQYYFWFIILSIIMPLHVYITNFVCLELDGKLNLAAEISKCATKTILSLLLIRSVGIAGLGIATFASYVISGIILAFHFLRKKNSIHVTFGKAFKEIPHAVSLSFGTALNSLLVSIMAFSLNYLVIHFIGSQYLVVVTIISFVTSLGMMLKKIGDTMSPYISNGFASENKSDFDYCIKLVKKYTLWGSIILSLIVMGLSPVIPFIYRIDPSNEAYIPCLVAALSSAAVYYFLVCGKNLGVVHNNIKKYSINTLSQVYEMGCLILFSFAFGIPFGLYGFIYGHCFGHIVCYVFMILTCYFSNHPHSIFPKLIVNEIQFSIDIYLDQNSIKEGINKINQNLKENNLDPNKYLLITSMLDEMLRVVDKYNKQNKEVIDHITICIGEKDIRILNKNNGRYISKEEMEAEYQNVDNHKHFNILYNVGDFDIYNLSSLNSSYLKVSRSFVENN